MKDSKPGFSAGRKPAETLPLPIGRERKRFILSLLLAAVLNLCLLTLGELFFYLMDMPGSRLVKSPPALFVTLALPAEKTMQSGDAAPEIAPEKAAPDAPTPKKESPGNTTSVPQGVSGSTAEAGAESTPGTYPGAYSPRLPESNGIPETAHSGNPAESAGETGMDLLYETIYSRIEEAKQYPPLARKRNIEGQVGIRITITSGGNLGTSAIEASSGSSILDQAAIRLVHSIFPLGLSLPVETTANIVIRYSLKE